MVLGHGIFKAPIEAILATVDFKRAPLRLEPGRNPLAFIKMTTGEVWPYFTASSL